MHGCANCLHNVWGHALEADHNLGVGREGNQQESDGVDIGEQMRDGYSSDEDLYYRMHLGWNVLSVERY